MTVQYLESGGSARLERGDVEVELTIHAGGPAMVEAIVGEAIVADAGSPAPEIPQRVTRLNRHRLALPAAAASVRLVVHPDGTDTFPVGTYVQLTVGTTVHGRRSQIVCPRTDVSALDEAVLATVSPGDSLFSVVQSFKIDDIGDTATLPPLVQATQYAARRLRRRGVVPAVADGVVLCVDTTASMLPHRRSGLMQLVVEVATGVDRGLGDGDRLPVFAFDRRVAALPALTADSVEGYASAVIDPLPVSTGSRVGQLLDGLGTAASGEALVLVVTDGVPGDVEACPPLRDGTSGRARWRLVLIGEQGELLDPTLSSAVRFLDANLRSIDLIEAPGASRRLETLVASLAGRDERTT